MRKIKIFMIGLLVASTAGIGVAQKMNAEQRATKVVEQISKVVADLSQEQKTQLHAANKKEAHAMMAIRKDARSSGEPGVEQKKAAREQMKALRAEKHEAYKKIMTPAQFELYKKWIIEQRKKAQPGRKRKGKKAKDA